MNLGWMNLEWVPTHWHRSSIAERGRALPVKQEDSKKVGCFRVSTGSRTCVLLTVSEELSAVLVRQRSVSPFNLYTSN